MAKNIPLYRLNKVVSVPVRCFTWVKRLWRKGTWQKLAISLSALLITAVGSMYGIARWYIARHANEPLTYGVTFIPSYARYLGVDPKATLDAILDELQVKQLRLVSYWNESEREQGVYDFTELDWQFAAAEARGAKVSLSIGLRQPRWPECHMPEWAKPLPMEEWSVHLTSYIGEVIDRYKTSPALESYQLENEFFLSAFGECPDFSRDRLIAEYTFVKEKDQNRPVIISRSNNAIGLPLGDPRPDTFGISIYKRVWDHVTNRYLEYPYPAWYYAFLAGAGELLTGKDMIIHELQAEAWMPPGMDMRSSSIEEQNKSLTAERLRDRFEYGRATGMRSMYLWGAEWWYWRKVYHQDASLWNVARTEMLAAQDL